MDNNIDTIIGINVVLKGSLKNKGSIQVNGTVEGELRSDEHINIGETAKVSGPVIAKTIEVSGEVQGLIEATERLEINPTGRVMGDLNAKSLIIQQGATFIGKSIMPGEETAALSALTKEPVKEIVKEEKVDTKEAVIVEKEEKEVREVKEVKEDKDSKEDKEEKPFRDVRDPLGFFSKK